MMASSDVRAVIFGMNALQLDRPLLLLLGEEVGKADHPGKVGAEVVVMDMVQPHHQALDIPAEAGPPKGQSGGAPTGGYPGSAADSHGAGKNQCGSSFYGPHGGGISHQGVGAGVSQPNAAAGYPSSVASGGNLAPGLSLGYSVNGAVRQGDGGLLLEALRGDDGRDRCTKCSRIPEPGFPLVPCVGCGMRACEVCCPMPARLCESCRITSCTPIGALISTVVDKDRFHHKCNTIVLPAEPTADKLREWLSGIKERVRNAFSFDSDYALAWISETERLDYDALGGPCKYPILDSNFTSAIRECIKTRAVRDKMNRLTEAIKGRQILKLLLNHLQTGVEDDQTFKIAELTSPGRKLMMGYY